MILINVVMMIHYFKPTLAL